VVAKVDKMGLSLGHRISSGKEGYAVYWGPNAYVEGVRGNGIWVNGGYFVMWPEWFKYLISSIVNKVLCVIYNHDFGYSKRFGQTYHTGIQYQHCAYCNYRERIDPSVQ
jgi:hypothetical protein